MSGSAVFPAKSSVSEAQVKAIVAAMFTVTDAPITFVYNGTTFTPAIGTLAAGDIGAPTTAALASAISSHASDPYVHGVDAVNGVIASIESPNRTASIIKITPLSQLGPTEQWGQVDLIADETFWDPIP